MSRLIDADKVLDKMRNTFEMQELYLPIHLKELITDDMPTVPAIVIPDGATNLDMLKAVFPNIKITYSKYDVEGTPHIIMTHGIDGVTSFTADWANAPYNKEVEKQTRTFNCDLMDCKDCRRYRNECRGV